MKHKFLALLLGFAFLTMASVRADEEKKKEDKDATPRVAHIKLDGDLDESPIPTDQLFGPPQENLSIKLNRIRRAAKDERVKALYVRVGELHIGFGKLNELRAAIAEFRATGKKTFAYAESYGTKEYLLAACCERILMPESGEVMMPGLRAEVMYFKKTLEKLHMKADVVKMGNYKSAVEPFLAESMSKENREQISSMLDDNFDHEIVATLVKGRKLDAEKAKAIVDDGVSIGKKAVECGLVDRLAYDDELPTIFAKELGVNEVKVIKNYAKAKAQDIDFSNPFALLATLANKHGTKESKEPKIAVIYAIGSIHSGKSHVSPFGGGHSMGSDTIVEAIRDAEKNETVKAIVLRIDSPGGSSLASDIIWRALKQCKKPVVVSMGDVAASGGYYIAAAGKKIYAEPGTVTGSIGVFGLKLVIEGTLDAIGIKTEIVARGKNSGLMSASAWSDSERTKMEAMVTDVYDTFLDRSLEGRINAGKKMTRDELKALAGGRVWTGRQALKNGLVDELGTLDDAIAEAKKLGGLEKKETEILPLPKAKNFFEMLEEGDAKLPFGKASIVEFKLIPGAEKALKSLSPILETQKEPIKLLLPYGVDFK